MKKPEQEAVNRTCETTALPPYGSAASCHSRFEDSLGRSGRS